MIDDKLFNLFGEGLKTVSACPACNRRYDPIEARILLEKDDSHLVYIKCRNCQTAVLVVIMANNLGISSIGLVTDLDSEDVLKFKTVESINFDDVIEMHQMLIKEKALIDQLN